jgi:hypothetical protein
MWIHTLLEMLAALPRMASVWTVFYDMSQACSNKKKTTGKQQVSWFVDFV